MKSFIECIVKELVDEPENVKVSESNQEEMTTYTIAVAPDDRGKIIGKHGRVVGAIRSVAKRLAGRQRQRINIEIATD